MKNMKKFSAIVLAIVMVLMYAVPVGVFAAPESGEFGNGTFSANPEDTITATGVTKGDSVEYYQLVEWKDGNWALTTLGTTASVPLADLIDGIDEAEATTIAKNLATAAKSGDLEVDTTDTTGTTYKKSGVDAGLYYLKAVPADTNKDTVYNPAFVSADYYSGNNSVSFTSTIGTSAVVKKSTIPFDKEVNNTDKFTDTKPGDIIPFKITTKIPSYGTSFTDPKFTITDTLSEGLALEGDVKVEYGDNETTASNADVLIKTGTPVNGYTVEFTKAYLTGLNGATPAVEVTYSAKVTTEALNNVTYMDNQAKLTFSNSPTTTKDQNDITRHYTFTIDGNLLGKQGEEGSELIKIGLDKNNEPITGLTKKTYHETEVGVLPQAEFELSGGGLTTPKTATSDTNGRINFKGLDAGTYTLKETKAPDGYIKDDRTFTVKIEPTYDTEIPDLLVSYKITFTNDKDNTTTESSFTMTNTGDTVKQTTVSSPESASQFVNNTQGTELPSTGGIGTTIFYILGAILVLGAGVLLVTRRRMRSSEE